MEYNHCAPCIYCDSTDSVVAEDDLGHTSVRCQDCGARGKAGDSVEEAIREWNELANRIADLESKVNLFSAACEDYPCPNCEARRVHSEWKERALS